MAADAPAGQPRISLSDLPGEVLSLLARTAKHDDDLKFRFSWKDIREARRSCKALRDAFDGHVTALTLPKGLDWTEVEHLVEGGRWPQRWPHCRKLTLPYMDERVCLPFVAAPPGALGHITELVLGDSPATSPHPLDSDHLLRVLSGLPGLRSLVLEAVAPAADDGAEQAVAANALSLLPSLTSLAIADYGYLPCIPDSLLTQLTRLEMAADFVANNEASRPTGEDLAALVARCTSLSELEMQYAVKQCFEPWELSELLDALPATVQRFDLHPVRPPEYGRQDPYLICSLSGGQLTGVEVSCASMPYQMLFDVIAEGLLPSRTLGPRLGRLAVFGSLYSCYPPETTDRSGDGLDHRGAGPLLARCDRIRVEELRAPPSLTEASSLVRLLGVPDKLSWPFCDTAEGKHFPIDVKLRPSAAAAAGAAPLHVPPLPALADKVLQHMTATAGGPDGGWLVLRGPLMRRLTGHARYLRAWMKWLGAAVSAAEPDVYVVGYRALPTAGAVAVCCDRDPGRRLPGGALQACQATAAVARRLAAEGGEGAGTGEEGEVLELEAVPGCIPWRKSAQQVLQALWDGEEEQGAGGAASVLPGGNDGGGSSGAAAGDGGDGEVVRLLGLLEAWNGLRSLAPRVVLDRIGRHRRNTDLSIYM